MAEKTVSSSPGHALLRQCSKPAGWLGRLNLRSMNRRHSRVTAWGLQHVSIGGRDTILDVGCGGGRTVGRLAAMAAEGKVYGVDYSAESVAVARRVNRPLVDAGRVEILHAPVSHLPFADETFDLVTAVETHYYWPDLAGDLREVRRVLKPGGTILVVAEAYKGGKHDKLLQRLEELQKRGILNYAHLTVGEHGELLRSAGYADVQVLEEYAKGWLCATARKAG